MTSWDHEQYLKFEHERTRPARELLARVPLASARRVVDLGSGPGNSTRLLGERFPGAALTGVDTSPDMLERARRELPDVEWIEGDVATYRPPEPVELLFANAVLQWVPEHGLLLPGLMQHLTPGGVLAVQMPRNHDEPSHRCMREMPAPFAGHIENARALSRVASPEEYYDLLAPHATEIDIWQTRYEHVMPSAGDIVEWVKGTGLRPYLEALPEALRPGYLERYTRAIDAAYPPRADGKRLFSFPRLFIVAVR